MNRRDFLTSTASLSTLLFLKACNFQNPLFESQINSSAKFIVGDGDEKFTTLNETYSRSSTSNASIFIGGINGEVTYLPAPGKVHEITKNPANPALCFASTKWGLEACLLDIGKKTLIKDIKTNGSDSFYGHSVFSSDGQFIYTSMASEYSGQGFVSVRDATTLNEVRRIATNGQMPHQIRWIEKDKILAVINSQPLNSANNKHHSVLSFIDVRIRTIIKSYPTSIAKQGHFSVTQDQSTAILCRVNSLGDTTLYEKLNLQNGELLTSHDYSPLTQKRIESLNHILFEDKSLVVMVITTLNRIVFWNYKENKVIHVEQFKDWTTNLNITEDRKHILIASHDNALNHSILVYHTDDFLNLKFNAYKTIKGGGSGSHMTIV